MDNNDVKRELNLLGEASSDYEKHLRAYRTLVALVEVVECLEHNALTAHDKTGDVLEDAVATLGKLANVAEGQQAEIATLKVQVARLLDAVPSAGVVEK